MPDDIEQPPRGYTTADVPSQPPGRKRRSWASRLKLIFAGIVAVVILGCVLYVWSALHFAYAVGERVGYLQKFSKEGWLCKTWEGELAMVNLPGTNPQIFRFTVRDDEVAKQISANLEKRVAITFEEHRGVPTRCFGETQYYVTQVRAVGGQ